MLFPKVIDDKDMLRNIHCLLLSQSFYMVFVIKISTSSNRLNAFFRVNNDMSSKGIDAAENDFSKVA